MPLSRWLRLAALRWRARACLLLGHDGLALDCFGAMLRLSSNDRHAMASRAFLLARVGNRPAAICGLQEMVRWHPRQASDWFNLAYLLDEDRQDVAAEAAFRQAVAIDPRLDRAWYGLGLLLIRQCRLDEAASVLRSNTALQPMSPFGWYQLARVEMDRQLPDEANRILQHLRSFEPKVAAQLARELKLSVAVAGAGTR